MVQRLPELFKLFAVTGHALPSSGERLLGSPDDGLRFGDSLARFLNSPVDLHWVAVVHSVILAGGA